MELLILLILGMLHLYHYIYRNLPYCVDLHGDNHLQGSNNIHLLMLTLLLLK